METNEVHPAAFVHRESVSSFCTAVTNPVPETLTTDGVNVCYVIAFRRDFKCLVATEYRWPVTVCFRWRC
jgi:hypothetical protein